MSEPSPRPTKRMRKGTRSCLECRKRKVRCTFDHHHGQAPCDACIDRQTTCQRQEHVPAAEASDPSDSISHRVGRLEAAVESLSDTVAWMQTTRPSGPCESADSGKYSHVANPDTRGDQESRAILNGEAVITPGAFGNDHNRNANETGDDAPPVGTEPAYLHSLFNNHVLSTAERAGQEHPLPPNTESRESIWAEKGSADLSAQVPCLADVRVVVASAADWWTIHNAVLSPLSVDSKQALIDAHPHHLTPAPSPTKVAMWLVYFAITLLQLPQDFDSTRLGSIKDPHGLVQRIFTHVDDFLSADSPLQARDGIECAIVLAKLASYLGRPRKAWLLTRRAVTFAQLLNLDRARRQFRNVQASGSIDSLAGQHLEASATVWESLSGLDRFLSLLLHLPAAAPSTLSKREQTDRRGSQNVLQHMMSEQSHIANRICYRDQLDSESDAEDETTRIIEDLSKLEQTQTDTWWKLDRSDIHDISTATPVLLQMAHYYIKIRANLPYLFRAKDNAKFRTNAWACMQACRDVLRRYFAVRTRLAEGVFLSRACEIQVFLACVILLLHRDRSSEYLPPTDSWESDATLLNNTKIAIGKAAAGTSDSFTEMLISALDQIEHCLDAVDGSRVVQLRVPLLGTISISRSATNFPPLENPTVPFWAIPPIMSSETLGIDEGIWDWPTDLNTLDDELSFWAVDTSLSGNPSNF
ncbi:hypothetical protein CB0940_02346 [Cercospora beticola]|uniref:Zn(2)-C6 fungal-type domain-containing protein n=1 Tax=Cercospora beticola TaxID=122368 RepID=A0A2G5I1V8_CERBT|nr:hypothetical protein CB0940_02346 [Cercospora beticola]PIA98750.1 hypothetical protein CB0940_02346 [Cercospora beticola]WPA99476.1 hypothetical protein RHO25_004093 [Cercospora beticola]